MRDPRKRSKRASSKPIKSSPSTKRKKLPITRAEARRQAERHVLRRMFRGATVRDGARVRLGIFSPGGWSAKDVWVVYLHSATPVYELRASQIIVVGKSTGKVLYEGSAHDEG